MNVHLPYDLSVKASEKKASENGMNRFFSPTNLARYQGWIRGKINAAERGRILKVLAHEWEAFTRECRAPSAIRVPPGREHVVFRRECSN
jgi:hypothetical protein